MAVIGCEPEPEPYTTKFEGTWVKGDSKFIFTGDVCVSQSVYQGSFRNSKKWSVKFNDTHIRLIMEAVWAENGWTEWPLDDRLEILAFAYTLNGNTLRLGDSGTSFNGEWTRE